MSTLVLISSAKRSTAVKKPISYGLIRRPLYRVNNRKPGFVTLFGGLTQKTSTAFNIMGTLSFAMCGILLLTVQSGSTTAFATTETTSTAVYAPFQEVQRFPKNQQQKKAELAQSGKATHLVQSGEVLTAVCLKLVIDCETVKELNNLVYPYNLRVGQELVYYK